MYGVLGQLDPEKDDLGHVFGKAGVVSGKGEDDVAGLSDVDVVIGDVVQEQQGLARCQGGGVRLNIDNVVQRKMLSVPKM
jgi:hypothetical protein